jgi:hypothetical protein
MISEHQPEWLDLKKLSHYASVSRRTLQDWMRLPSNPLPASRVGVKILVRRMTFDAWLASFTLKPVDLDAIVDEVFDSVTNGR